MLTRTVAGAFAAAERHVVVDPRSRQIDHDHARLAFALEVRGMLERCSHDAGRESEIGIVGHCERFAVVLDLDHAGYRTEYFLARAAHGVGCPGQQRRREIVTLLGALQRFAAVSKRRTFALADADVIQVLLELRLVDDRADIGPRY